ncbi:MAG: hypothetical protein WC538_00455 [Thermoanaerobaculia bacterium]|jgi:hypothetical protein
MNTDVYLLLVHAGDHRGGVISFRSWLDVSRELEVRLSLLAIDAIYARRVEMVRLATAHGLHAEVGPGSLQEARREGLFDERSWIYLAFDKPKSIMESIDMAGQMHRGIVVSIFIEFPTWPLVAFRAVIDAGDVSTRMQTRLLFERLGDLTTLTGSAAIFGPGARSQNALIEPLMRQGFLRQGLRAIVKRSLGQEPDVVPIAMSFDGTTEVSTLIIDARGGVQNPKRVAAAILADPPFPLIPGSEIVVIQIAPNRELVLNRARLRSLDNSLRLGRARTIDAPFLEDVLRSGDRNVVSAVNPVRMSD